MADTKKTAAAKVEKFRKVAKFTDVKKAQLVVIAKQSKTGGFEVLASHTPSGGKKTPLVRQFFTEVGKAAAKFDEVVKLTEVAGWTQVVKKVAGKSKEFFLDIPAAAKTKAAA